MPLQCWCSIPALIYQTASPVFQRIRPFSNAYVHAVVDIIYTILWLAAFACLTTWIRQGSHAAKDWKSKDSLCEKFAWGPVSKCKLGQDTGLLSIITWYGHCTLSNRLKLLIFGSSLLFALTSAFSIYGVLYYRKNGTLPQYSIQEAQHLPIEDQDFSADTSDKLNDHDNVQLNHSTESEIPFPSTNTESQTHPSGPIPWNLQSPPTAPAELAFEPVDTSYHGGVHAFEPLQRPQSRPSFPYSAGNGSLPYDTHHSAESQFGGGLKPWPAQNDARPSRQNLALDFDHGGYASGGARVDFPEGDYGR